MAKYEVTYACGHNGVIKLLGPTKDRDYWLGREAEKLCPECQARQDEQTLVEIRAEWEKQGLPALTGSTKQILWANKLRNLEITKAKEKLEDTKHKAEKYPDKLTPDGAEFIAHYDDCMNMVLRDSTASSVWIDGDRSLVFRIAEVWQNRKAEVLAADDPVKTDVPATKTAEPENKRTNSVEDAKGHFRKWLLGEMQDDRKNVPGQDGVSGHPGTA